MKISSGFTRVCIVFLAAISFCWCIYRDIQIEKQYPGDLRNRIVGARMEKDGLSPYFYHWKAGDGMRYYDWDNSGTAFQMSNVTATPFFHQLLYPLAALPQRTISKIWLALEYFALLSMTVLALRFAQNVKQKRAVIITGLLFLYSYAWLTNIAMGQLYIFIPFVSMLFFYFICGDIILLNAIGAALCATSLVLIRPNTILFLLPFLLLANRYSLKYKVTMAVSCILILLLSFGSSRSLFYWSDYMKAMNDHIKMHQGMQPSLQVSPPVASVTGYEGWDWTQINEAQLFRFYTPMEEHGNVFVLLNSALHVQTPLWLLSLLSVGFMLILCFLFYVKYRGSLHPDICSIALLGYLLYMTSDLFSPVHRFSYNTSQWIFPLLLTAGTHAASYKNIYIILIVGGLLLNSIPFYLFPMRHTLGEYMIYASFLGILFTAKPCK